MNRVLTEKEVGPDSQYSSLPYYRPSSPFISTFQSLFSLCNSLSIYPSLTPLRLVSPFQFYREQASLFLNSPSIALFFAFDHKLRISHLR